MSSRGMFRRPLAGVAAAVLLAVPLSGTAAQAVPTWPGDSITRRAAPADPGYAASGPIAPTLPGDTLLGQRLSPDAAVPREEIAPTMPGDVITQPPQWVLDTLRADSVRQGLLPPDSAEVQEEEEFRVLPDAPERADSLRLEPEPRRPDSRPEQPRRPRRDDALRRS